jgi:NAD(P)-dependent dehydrogenase (short-subunit alcohol dehydrogenase family)
MMFRLDSKVAIVTGAARGLGAAAARTLARQGARVAAADLQIEELRRASSTSDGGIEADQIKPYALDVSDVKGLRRFVDAVQADFGRIDILVNNAGICPRLSFEQTTEADFDRLMGVNARSQYFLCQAVVPIMRSQGGGRIINVASTGGRIGGFANSSAYSGTKGAVVMFTKSIAREVARDGILVNCIAPGVFDTDLMRNIPAEKVDAICSQIPIGRLGRPEEVASMIAFLASDECSYATGATFDINGGWVML